MVTYVEFRIRMPFSVEEYHRGKRYCIAKMSREEAEESGRKDIVTIDEWKPYKGSLGDGVQIRKSYRIGRMLPSVFKALVPTEKFTIVENVKDAFPRCRVSIHSKTFRKRDFRVTTQSEHKDGIWEQSEDPNSKIHKLKPNIQKQVKVVYIDIAKDKMKYWKPKKEFAEPKDVQLHVVEPRRGPLSDQIDRRSPDCSPTAWWKQYTKGGAREGQPCMTCYKLAILNFTLVPMSEGILQSIFNSIYLRLHKQIYTTANTWLPMTEQELGLYENGVRKELKGSSEPHP